MAGDITWGEAGGRNEAYFSGVSWAAVIGGAIAAAAIYLILLALGAGLDLSAVSPWNANGETLTASTIIWLIVIEIIASTVGGYLTGRLRTKWVAIHNDEVYFRDTANGFLAWAVALVLSSAFLASTAAAMVGSLTTVQMQPGSVNGTVIPNALFVDRLLRSDKAGTAVNDSAKEAEVGRVLSSALKPDGLSAEDQSYLARLTSDRTGLTALDAEKRVRDIVTALRLTENSKRKETARLLLWWFLSLLGGAFCASLAAIAGGRQRDHLTAV